VRAAGEYSRAEEKKFPRRGKKKRMNTEETKAKRGCVRPTSLCGVVEEYR
jgi:hypothetical protein